MANLELSTTDWNTTPRGEDRSLSAGTPSRPLLGRLPLKRIIPQDVHSVMDYLDAAAVLGIAWTSDCRRAKIAGSVLGGAGIVASALTDYRLSLAKLVPIETHESSTTRSVLVRSARLSPWVTARLRRSWPWRTLRSASAPSSRLFLRITARTEAQVGVKPPSANVLAPGGISDDARVLTGSILKGEGITFIPFRLTVPRGTFY